jgi:hypothetical protein
MEMLRQSDPEKYQKEINKQGDKEGWHLKFASQDAYSSTGAPGNWRNPRTITTLTWRDAGQ